MTAAKVEVGTVNLLDKLTADRTLPEGYDGWLIRTVRPDFTSQHGYRYPFPGSEAVAPGPIVEANHGECLTRVGDGICAARTWRGMASGGVPARTLLLVAYRDADVLGGADGSEKIRLRAFHIVDVVDGEMLVKTAGSADLYGADLRGADLYGANLRGANLRGADLYGADLRGADLYGADLYGANLRGANLRGADLYGANLRGANLRGADLYGADLRGADLYGADLYGANLRGANLRGANLRGADLYGADLRGANLYGANLYGANLRGANLRGADLYGANLYGADLRGALSLTQSQVDGARVDRWTQLPSGLTVPGSAVTS